MTQNEQHDIMEAKPQKEGILVRASRRIEATGTKTLVVFGVIGALLVGGGFLVAEVLEERFDRSNHSHYHQGLGVHDHDHDDQDDDRPAGSVDNSVNQAPVQTSPSIPVVETSELDGTYIATVQDESYTLIIKGNQATLQTSEMDGEQEVEQVIFDLEKKVAYVDGEAETYTFDGTKLVLTEVDNELFGNDQITFTKQ